MGLFDKIGARFELDDGDHRRARVKIESLPVFERLRDHFSVKNNQKAFYKNNYHIQDKLYAISTLGSFLLGMTPEVIKTLKILYPGLKCVIDSKLVGRVWPLREYKNELLSNIVEPLNPEYEYRDYQLEAISKALSVGRGVLLLPTSAGKSLIGLGILLTLLSKLGESSKALVIVPRTQLVEQFYTDFLDYGLSEHIKIQRFSGTEKEDILEDSRIIIANRQYIERHSKEMPDFDIVIVDECIRKGQKVLCKNYVKNIEDVNIRDMVLTYNFKDFQNEYKKVIKTYRNLTKSSSYDNFLQITTEDGKTIEVTPNHELFLNSTGEPIRADNLKIGDDIVTM